MMFGNKKISVKQIALSLALLVAITLLLTWLYPKRDLVFAVFSPFLLAFVIAYILNPAVNFFDLCNRIYTHIQPITRLSR